MKQTLLLLLAIMLSVSQIFAQNDYNKTKESLAYLGYTIVEDRYNFIAQGETMYINKTFYAGVDYIIYGFSEDGYVIDLDLTLKNSYQDIIEEDDDDDDSPVIVYSTSYDRTLKVSLKNYESSKPNRKSKCFLMIAYKQ